MDYRINLWSNYMFQMSTSVRNFDKNLSSPLYVLEGLWVLAGIRMFWHYIILEIVKRLFEILAMRIILETFLLSFPSYN